MSKKCENVNDMLCVHGAHFTYAATCKWGMSVWSQTVNCQANFLGITFLPGKMEKKKRLEEEWAIGRNKQGSKKEIENKYQIND